MKRFEYLEFIPMSEALKSWLGVLLPGSPSPEFAPSFRSSAVPLSAFRFPLGTSRAEQLRPKKQSSVPGWSRFLFCTATSSRLRNDDPLCPATPCLADTTRRFARPMPCPVQTMPRFTGPRRYLPEPGTQLARPRGVRSKRFSRSPGHGVSGQNKDAIRLKTMENA